MQVADLEAAGQTSSGGAGQDSEVSLGTLVVSVCGRGGGFTAGAREVMKIGTACGTEHPACGRGGARNACDRTAVCGAGTQG